MRVGHLAQKQTFAASQSHEVNFNRNDLSYLLLVSAAFLNIFRNNVRDLEV